MPAIDSHTPGSFCWSELVTSDVDAALVFYGTLFGWEPEESDLGDASRYVRCTLNGRYVAAIVQMSEEECTFQVHPYWVSYVRTSDVAGALDKVEGLGGTRFEGPIEVPGAGTLGTVEDPDGARLCLWQPAGFEGSGWVREIGAPAWNELMTRQPDAIRDFYAGLLGWTPITRDMGSYEYTSFLVDGEDMGGIQAMDERHDGVAAQWLIYVAVANVEATVEAAVALDAKVLVPTTLIPNVGTFALLKGPHGGMFSVIQMLDLAN